MQLDIVSELWNELKRYINTMDRSDAAESVVSVLVENGIGADEIQEAFSTDANIKSALAPYLDDQDEEDDYDELNFDDDE